MEKIKLVVIEKHTLGYLIPGTNLFGVLRASVLRGSPFSELSSPVNLGNMKWELAGEKEFRKFRVVFDGFKRRPNIYEFKENNIL